jgi:hypothetical protein
MKEINKLNITTGFITPDNEQIEVSISKMGEFCQKYCLLYSKESLKNNKHFEQFSKKYSYFKPYFDFIMHELKWLQIGTVFDQNNISLSRKDDEKTKVLLQPRFDRKDISINNIYQYLFNKSYGWQPLPTCSDIDMQLNSCYSYLNTSGYLFNDGTFIDIPIMHFRFSQALLNEILLENNIILDDYKKQITNKDYTAEDYLIGRLGVIKFDNYRSKKMYYVNELMSNEQLEIINECLKNNISACEINGIDNIEVAKTLQKK